MLDPVEAARRRCVLYDLTPAGRLFVSGPDAARLLAETLTCDVSALTESAGAQTLLCNEEGGILDLGMLYRQGAERWLLRTSPGGRDVVRRWLQGHRRSGMDLRIDDRSESTSMPAILGPGARHAFTAVLSGEIEQTLRPGHCREIELNRTKALITRTGFAGEDGFEFVCSADAAVAIRDHFLAANVLECSDQALELLRIEAGIPAFETELGARTNPWEAGLGTAISLDGERRFDGREALTSLRTQANHSLAVLKATTGGPFEAGSQLFFQGEQVARLTSTARAGESEPAIGLAFLPVHLATPGRLFHAGSENGQPAEVVPPRRGAAGGPAALQQNLLNPDA